MWNIIYRSRLETTLETTALGMCQWFLGQIEQGKERERQGKREREGERVRSREREPHRGGDKV